MSDNKLQLLDLFCGAGGCTRGYQMAGFEVTGVDSVAQPRYCGDHFIQADALTVSLAGYDVIHASPPCQRYTAMAVMWNVRANHPDLVGPVRQRLRASGTPFVIENVPGAPLPTAITLCGSAFGLGIEGYQLRRHRHFEVWPWLVLAPPCQHRGPVLGVYGDHVRSRQRHSGHLHRGMEFSRTQNAALAGQAMGIDWMLYAELREAIPPAYTHWIGAQLLAALALGAPPGTADPQRLSAGRRSTQPGTQDAGQDTHGDDQIREG